MKKFLTRGICVFLAFFSLAFCKYPPEIEVLYIPNQEEFLKGWIESCEYQIFQYKKLNLENEINYWKGQQDLCSFLLDYYYVN